MKTRSTLIGKRLGWARWSHASQAICHWPLVCLSAGLLFTALACSRPEAEILLPAIEPLREREPQIAELLERKAAAVRERPETGDAWLDLGRALHANGFFDHALASYRQANQLDGENPKAWYLEAVAEEETGDLETAVAHLERTLSLTPRTAHVHRRLGRILIALGRPSEAATAFEEALEIAPSSATGQLGLARARLEAGETDKAVQGLEQLASGTSDAAPHALRLLTTVYAGLSRFQQAASASRGAAASQRLQFDDPWLEDLEPMRVSTAAQIARSGGLLAQGEADEAVRRLEALAARPSLRPSQKISIATNLGIAYLEARQSSKAIAVLTDALALDPGHYRAHYLLASALARSASDGGDRSAESQAETLEKAQEHVDQALALNPGYAQAYGLDGDLALSSGDRHRAERSYLEASRRDPDNANWLLRAATIAGQRGDWPTAAGRLELLLNTHPANAEGWRLLGITYARLGRTSDARQVLEQARRLAPDDERIVAELKALP